MTPLVALVLLTGCSDDNGDGSTAAPTTSQASPSSGSSSPAPTGSEVVLGVISDDSGATGATDDMPETAKRWASYTNSKGGLNGHPVRVVVKDTKNNAGTALQAAKDLVENEKVIAIGDNSFSNQAYAKYLAEKKIPVFGFNTGAATFNYVTDPNFFTPSTTVPTVLAALPKAAALRGKKAFSFLYCAEIAACGQAVPIVEGGAKAAGMTAPYSASYSASAPNYTAQCLAARKAGVDALFAGGPVPAANKRVYDDCAKQGYKPLALFSISTFNEKVLEDDLIEELVGVVPVRPWFLNDTPGLNAFHKAMDDFLPKATSQPVIAAIWTGLELFAAAAKNISAAPSSQEIYDGLYALKDATLDGLSVPLTYTKGKPGSSTCLFAYGASKGKLEVLNDGQPLCVGQAPTS